MAKKQFLDKAGVEALVNKTKSAISTAKTETINTASDDATTKVNAALLVAAQDATSKADAAREAAIAKTQEVNGALGTRIDKVSAATTVLSNQAKADAIKHADDADAPMKADIAELKDAVWPLELTFSVSPSVIKVGQAASIACSWTVKRKGADVTESATVKLNNTAVTGKSKTVSIAAADATAGAKAQTLAVEYQGISKSETRNVTAVYPSFCGTVANGWTPTAAAVKALGESLQTSRSATKTGLSITNGKIVYAYPKSYGALTSVKDGNNFEVLGSYTRSEVTVDGVEYYCYVLTNPVTASGVKQVYA